MNVIVIVSDTLRRDHLNCYMPTRVKTPNLDMLARSSVLFERLYTGSFPTIPHRTDLMTGRYVFHTRGWSPLEKEKAIQEILLSAGYVTGMITDTYVYYAPGMNLHRGFSGYKWIRGQQGDNYVTAPIPVKYPCAKEKLRSPEKLVEQHLRNTAFRQHEREWFVAQVMSEAADWLEGNADHEKFYLYIDAFDVHEPWDPPRWYVDLYDPGYTGEEVILPRYDRCDYLTEEELNHVRALYAGEITLMDKWLGVMLEKLKDLGLWDNTAILFTSDHGFYHGEHGYIGKHTVFDRKKGWQLYEEVSHTPLLLKIPGIEGGQRCSALVQPVDLMPTLLEAVGVPAPAGGHGESIMPILRNEEEKIRSLAVSSPILPRSEDVIAYSTITDGDWTLIYGGKNVPAELYYIPDDPKQQKNLAAEKPEIVKQLHADYVEMLKGIDCPDDRLELRKEINIDV